MQDPEEETLAEDTLLLTPGCVFLRIPAFGLRPEDEGPDPWADLRDLDPSVLEDGFLLMVNLLPERVALKVA